MAFLCKSAQQIYMLNVFQKYLNYKKKNQTNKPTKTPQKPPNQSNQPPNQTKQEKTKPNLLLYNSENFLLLEFYGVGGLFP